MKQGLFLNGIDVARNELSENQCFQDTALILAHAANSPAAGFNHAAVAAKIAFDFVVLQGLIQVGFHGGMTPIRFKVCGIKN